MKKRKSWIKLWKILEKESKKEKRKNMKNKKAISPLIATVLLIAFAVALGAIVMNWGRTYTQEQIDTAAKRSDEEIECGLDVELAIKEVAGEPQLFYTNSTSNLTFMLENKGRKTINSIRVVIIGQDGEDINITDLTDSKIITGGIIKRDVTYTDASIDQVVFIPYLNTTGSTKPTLCTRNKLEKDDIPSRT